MTEMIVATSLNRRDSDSEILAVSVDRRIDRAFADVWARIVDIERYPAHMARVETVTVTNEDGSTRDAEWQILLRGSRLRWTERGVTDAGAGRVEFHQLDGDLSVFRGYWQVAEMPGFVSVELSVDFCIGIPLLATMLNAIATRAMTENLNAMLDYLECDA